MNIFSAWRLTLSSFMDTWTRPSHQRHADRSVIAVVTEYHTKTAHQHEFVEALSAYVGCSLRAGGNIMSEAYYEKGDICVMWVIERWSNYHFYKKNSKSREGQVIRALTKTGVTIAVDTTFLKDLLSLSNQSLVIPSRGNNQPVTIMLLVDVKAGTEDQFRSINQTVMSVFRNKPGVLLFQLSKVIYDKTKFIVCKKFRDWDAFQYHLKDPALQPVITFLQTSVKEPPYEKGYHHLIQFAPLHGDE